MTASELQEWLGSDESAGSGWSKDDGSGETIGYRAFSIFSVRLAKIVFLC